MKSIALAAVMIVTAALEASGQEVADRAESRSGFSPEQIMKNMPVYNDRRCVGVSLVAAALLEGKPIDDDGFDSPGELGKRIYEAACTKERVQFHRELRLGLTKTAIGSPAALDALSTAVADEYKSQYEAMKTTNEGRARLWRADSEVLRKEEELLQLLEADRDKIMAFPVTGKRTFPDGSILETSHAILIAKKPTGTIIIYDPNDRGEPLPCRLNETAEGLRIGWTCGYKDTGLTTTQDCRLLHAEKVFRLILGRD